jgi:hypothetical protein
VRATGRTFAVGSLVLVVVAVLTATGLVALFTAQGTSNGSSFTAGSVNAGMTPTASVTGSAVTISWAASTASDGRAVSGYLVKRYDTATLTSQSMLSACTGTVAATTCVESNVPGGQWKYSVTPVFGTTWQGAESALSSTVLVGPLAVADSYTVNEDAVLTVAAGGVLTNDTGSTLTAILVSGVAHIE